jgi:hypothetical protein
MQGVNEREGHRETETAKCELELVMCMTVSESDLNVFSTSVASCTSQFLATALKAETLAPVEAQCPVE